MRHLSDREKKISFGTKNLVIRSVFSFFGSPIAFFILYTCHQLIWRGSLLTRSVAGQDSAVADLSLGASVVCLFVAIAYGRIIIVDDV